MSWRTVTNDNLMAAAAQKDSDAFAELMRRHRPWVYNLVLRSVRDRDYADDVVQEVFCRVHLWSTAYRAEGRFESWLKCIAEHLAIDFDRKRRRLTDMPLCDLEAVAMAASDPAAEFLAKAEQEDICAAIAKLCTEQRTVITMRFYRDMTSLEAAVLMGCPAGTVKSRTHYAVVHLRATLTAMWAEAPIGCAGRQDATDQSDMVTTFTGDRPGDAKLQRHQQGGSVTLTMDSASWITSKQRSSAPTVNYDAMTKHLAECAADGPTGYRYNTKFPQSTPSPHGICTTYSADGVDLRRLLDPGTSTTVVHDESGKQGGIEQ